MSAQALRQRTIESQGRDLAHIEGIFGTDFYTDGRARGTKELSCNGFWIANREARALAASDPVNNEREVQVLDFLQSPLDVQNGEHHFAVGGHGRYLWNHVNEVSEDIGRGHGGCMQENGIWLTLVHEIDQPVNAAYGENFYRKDWEPAPNADAALAEQALAEAADAQFVFPGYNAQGRMSLLPGPEVRADSALKDVLTLKHLGFESVDHLQHCVPWLCLTHEPSPLAVAVRALRLLATAYFEGQCVPGQPAPALSPAYPYSLCISQATATDLDVERMLRALGADPSAGDDEGAGGGGRGGLDELREASDHEDEEEDRPEEDPDDGTESESGDLNAPGEDGQKKKNAGQKKKNAAIDQEKPGSQSGEEDEEEEEAEEDALEGEEEEGTDSEVEEENEETAAARIQVAAATASHRNQKATTQRAIEEWRKAKRAAQELGTIARAAEKEILRRVQTGDAQQVDSRLDVDAIEARVVQVRAAMGRQQACADKAAQVSVCPWLLSHERSKKNASNNPVHIRTGLDRHGAT